MMSEHALADQGWMMNLAFRAAFVANIALAIALFGLTSNIAGRFGCVLLIAVAAAWLFASFNQTDSVPDTIRGATTTAGGIHNLCGLVANAGLPIAAVLINVSLSRTDARRYWARRRLIWLTPRVLVGLVCFIVFLVPQDPRPGSGTGIPNRRSHVFYMLWLIIVSYKVSALLARHTRQIRRGECEPGPNDYFNPSAPSSYPMRSTA